MFRGRELPFLTRWSSGAVYLWHAPILLPASSIVLSRLGITELPGLVAAIAITAVASVALNEAISRTRIANWLTL